MPYTLEGASNQLRIADAINAIEFYVCHTDGKTHGFSARCWDFLNSMKKDDVDLFVSQLNEAIAPVKRKWLLRITEDVQQNFPKPKA